MSLLLLFLPEVSSPIDIFIARPMSGYSDKSLSGNSKHFSGSLETSGRNTEDIVTVLLTSNTFGSSGKLGKTNKRVETMRGGIINMNKRY